MAGGTRRHAVLKSRVSTELTIGLGRSGLRRVVVCGEGITELEVWSRVDAEAEWTRELHTSGRVVTLALGVTLAVDDLYRDPLPPR